MVSVTELRSVDNGKYLGWLNSAAIQRTYSLTYEGLRQTLYGLDSVAHQLSGFEQYVRRRDIK